VTWDEYYAEFDRLAEIQRQANEIRRQQAAIKPWSLAPGVIENLPPCE